MRGSSRRFIKIALLCGAMAMPTFTANVRTAPADAVSGVWRVTVTPDDDAVQAGKDVFEDMLLFENGQLSASACSSLGFSQAAYSIGEGGSTFNCTMSTEDETMLWSANYGSSSMSGSVTWTKPDGQVFHFTLSGSRASEYAEQQGSEGGD